MAKVPKVPQATPAVRSAPSPAAPKTAAAPAQRRAAAIAFTISELAAEFDITSRAIRFYEDVGLLTPERAGRNRVYTQRDRTRLKLTLRADAAEPFADWLRRKHLNGQILVLPVGSRAR